MKKCFFGVLVACSLVGLIGTAAAADPQKGSGYWAGRLCDHVGPSTGGTTYWQSRNYP